MRLLRQSWPWLVGIAILALIATRVPYAAFRSAITRGPHLTLATVDLLVVTITLFTDGFATWVGLIAVRMRRPFAQVIAVRGATFVLFIINYALGQSGFGFYLHRSGTSALRAVGATLFLIGTNLATLLVVTTIAWWMHGAGADPKLWITLLAGCGAYAIYLVVIAVAPAALARRELLAPLFVAGLRGHAAAMIVRVPHVIIMSLGVWAAMYAWGIPVPLSTGLTLMPIVVIASALPIAPAGLGTTQAALVYFFSAYAVGATADDRAASVLAFAIVHFVYGVLAILVIGIACMPLAKRTGAMQAPAASGT